jgi:hypothetical protein
MGQSLPTDANFHALGQTHVLKSDLTRVTRLGDYFKWADFENLKSSQYFGATSFHCKGDAFILTKLAWATFWTDVMIFKIFSPKFVENRRKL